MKSIKPGRGPSMMGVVGAVIAVIFGIFWTAFALSMGAPGFFPVFGILFIGAGIAMGIYNYKNATGKNRYSAFDITDANEEPDPLQQRVDEKYSSFGSQPESTRQTGTHGAGGFCPYCGASVAGTFDFCPRCGRKLPK